MAVVGPRIGIGLTDTPGWNGSERAKLYAISAAGDGRISWMQSVVKQ
jgi:hypothetical protein